MNCLLQVALFCLFDPSSVYASGDVSYQFHGDFHYVVEGVDYGGGRRFSGEIGVLSSKVTRTNLFFMYGVRHESLYNVDDGWGDNRWFVRAIWFPFDRR